MKNSKIGYMSTPSYEGQTYGNPTILRVVLSEEYTKIDFSYVAPWIYIRGGWIRIAPHTFIQVHGSEKKYKLKEAVNIPIAPEILHFDSTQDWLVFSLIFEAIPQKECLIDLIEQVIPDDDDFNYLNVKIDNLTPIFE